MLLEIDLESSPIHECLITRAISEMGIGNLFVSRRLPDGMTAFVVFLLDTFCLGVKNAMFTVVESDSYSLNMAAIRAKEELVDIEPCCGRKLVDGSVAYARSLGFFPHKDYALARPMLSDADPEACETEFEFGHEGKPLYVAGPEDTPARARAVIQALLRSKGRDGFDFMVPAGVDVPIAARTYRFTRDSIAAT